MAGFVLLALAMRRVGGWLSGRIGPVRVLSRSLAAVVVAAPGAASGATFAFMALLARSGPVRSPVWSAPRAAWAASCPRW